MHSSSSLHIPRIAVDFIWFLLLVPLFPIDLCRRIPLLHFLYPGLPWPTYHLLFIVPLSLLPSVGAFLFFTSYTQDCHELRTIFCLLSQFYFSHTFIHGVRKCQALSNNTKKMQFLAIFIKSPRIIRHEKVWVRWGIPVWQDGIPWEDQIDLKAHTRNLNETSFDKMGSLGRPHWFKCPYEDLKMRLILWKIRGDIGYQNQNIEKLIERT